MENTLCDSIVKMADALRKIDEFDIYLKGESVLDDDMLYFKKLAKEGLADYDRKMNAPKNFKKCVS